jgi:hypothetical protein
MSKPLNLSDILRTSADRAERRPSVPLATQLVDAVRGPIKAIPLFGWLPIAALASWTAAPALASWAGLAEGTAPAAVVTAETPKVAPAAAGAPIGPEARVASAAPSSGAPVYVAALPIGGGAATGGSASAALATTSGRRPQSSSRAEVRDVPAIIYARPAEPHPAPVVMAAAPALPRFLFVPPRWPGANPGFFRGGGFRGGHR